MLDNGLAMNFTGSSETDIQPRGKDRWGQPQEGGCSRNRLFTSSDAGRNSI